MRLLALLLLGASFAAQADLTLPPFKHGDTSYKSPCFPLYSTASDGVSRLSGMSGSDGDFIIYLQTDNVAADVEFQTTADIETIATIGTYVAPTANTDIRFGECGTPGTYQVMLHNDYVATVGASALTLTLTDGGDTMIDQLLVLNLDVADLNDFGDELVDRLRTEEAEAGLTFVCLWLADFAVSAGAFDRTAGEDAGGVTTWYAFDGETPRVEGTTTGDPEIATRAVEITCPS